ncbi:MAG: hypothetical protein OIF48_05405 [Silicimonas sp.]|nr:hypothetical protein [Silicimonas sp.]
MALFLICLLAGQGPGAAEDIRSGAARAAEWALEQENAPALADAITLLLDSGAALDPDDPFSVADLVTSLRRLDGGVALAKTLEARQSRGQFDGAPRQTLTLAAGESREIPMTMVPGEAALIEARLWRGAGGADIDLILRDDEGRVIAEDTGPETGVEGYGVFVEFFPETCLDLTVTLENRGADPARIAVLAPLSLRDSCEE